VFHISILRVVDLFGGAKINRSRDVTELWAPCDSVPLQQLGVWRAADTAQGTLTAKLNLLCLSMPNIN